MKYTELFKDCKPDLENLSGKIQEAFMKAYLPNFYEFPSIDETAKIYEGDIFNIYKLKNTTFLENWKINLKTAEKQLKQILNTSVKIVREKWLFFLESLKSQEDINDYLNKKTTSLLANNDNKDSFNLWINNFWKKLNISIKDLKNLFIFWNTGSWKTKSMETLLQTYLNRKENNIIILEEHSYNRLGKYSNCCNEANDLDSIDDLEIVLTFIENQIKDYKKAFKKEGVSNFEQFNAKNKKIKLKRTLIFLDWLKNHNFKDFREWNDVNLTFSEKESSLFEKFKILTKDSDIFGINVIISTSDSSLLSNSLISNFNSFLTFKTKLAPNGDINSIKLLGVEGASELPQRQIWYFKNETNWLLEIIRVLTPWGED